MPPQASGTSAKSAKAFVRYYIDLVNYAMRTGDTSNLRALGTRECVSCKAIAANIDKVYSAGGHIETAGWRLTIAFPVPDQPRRRPIFDLGIVEAPEVVVPRANASPKTYKGGKQPMTIHLDWRRGEWRVVRLDLVT